MKPTLWPACLLTLLLVTVSCTSKPLRDCDGCPAMVRVPGGTFQIGSAPGSPGHINDEAPQKTVTVNPFWVSRHEVTVGQFASFVAATGYADEDPCLVMRDSGSWEYDPAANWQNPGFEQNDDHPVVCVSWNAAKAYVAWLNIQSGGAGYRLLSESEWEYAARAGSTTTYWWGENEGDFCTYTNGVDRSARARYPMWERSGDCDDGFVYTAPVGHYGKPNRFGLEDLVGNVWEWTEDCYAEGFAELPSDGAPLLASDCEKRVVRGGAWGDYGSFYLRSAYRGAFSPSWGFSNLGVRVARRAD